MKNIRIKNIVVSVVFCLLVFSLSACTTTLKGTYSSTEGVRQTFTFEDDNKVTVSAFGLETEGTYVIKDGKITITYDIVGIKYDWKKDFKKKGNSVYIDGTEFIKE